MTDTVTVPREPTILREKLLSEGAVCLEGDNFYNCDDDANGAVIVIPVQLRNDLVAMLSAAPKAQPPSVEDVARVIDPEAFANIADDQTPTEREISDRRYKNRCLEALLAGQRILSLFSTTEGATKSDGGSPQFLAHEDGEYNGNGESE